MSAKLHLSEHFDSVQGEGNHCGWPAIFWRFKGCVLNCSFCDTAEVWKRGQGYEFSELYELFDQAGYFRLLNTHRRILVITGGDPLLQQSRIAQFFQFCEDKGDNPGNWRIEVENQASIKPTPDFSCYVSQWNISPKLANSGEPEEKRIVPDVVEWMVKQTSIFKFPVEGEQDMSQVREYAERFNISPSRVYLMPICSTQEQHQKLGRTIIELAKQGGYRFSPRLQLAFYDQTCGV